MWIPWVSCSPMASFQRNEAVRPGQLNQHHHNNPGDNHHGGYDHHHRGDNHSSNHHYCGHYNTCKHHCSHYSQHHRWNNYDYGLHDFGCDDCHDHGFGGVQETLWEVRGYELRWGNLLRAWLLVGGFKYIFRFDIVCGMNQYLSPLGSLRLVVCVWWPLLLPSARPPPPPPRPTCPPRPNCRKMPSFWSNQPSAPHALAWQIWAPRVPQLLGNIGKLAIPLLDDSLFVNWAHTSDFFRGCNIVDISVWQQATP